MPAPEEARKQVALTSLSTLPDSAKGFWWTDDDLATILAASDEQPGPLYRLYRTELDWAGGGLRGADKVFPGILWAHIIRNVAQLYPGSIPYSSVKQRWLQGLLLPPGMSQKSVGRNLTRRRNRALAQYREPPLCQYCNHIPLIV